jgi:hypothetical protein
LRSCGGWSHPCHRSQTNQATSAVAARQEEKVAERLREGPEGEVLADLRILEAVGARLKRRLSALSSPSTALPPAITAAVASCNRRSGRYSAI